MPFPFLVAHYDPITNNHYDPDYISHFLIPILYVAFLCISFSFDSQIYNWNRVFFEFLPLRMIGYCSLSIMLLQAIMTEFYIPLVMFSSINDGHIVLWDGNFYSRKNGEHDNFGTYFYSLPIWERSLQILFVIFISYLTQWGLQDTFVLFIFESCLKVLK